MRKRKEFTTYANKITPFILLFFAIAFIAGSLLVYQSNSKYKEQGIMATAEIIDFRYDYSSDNDLTAIVSFTVGGKTIEGRLNYYSSSMKIGDTVPVYYMEDNPYDFAYGGSTFLIFAIVIGVGAILFIVSITLFISAPIKKSKLNKLKTNGHRKQVTVKAVNVKWNTTINGMHPAKIICQDTVGKEYVQKVRIFMQSDYQVGDKIDIYVDVDNPSKYIFDLQSLERKPLESFGEPFEF